ncbi:MAG: hypothetical protein HC795_10335 [Coleofasciculaceae cyanobacterium RL_1_1]|nr:hypothetical protein [Coleofasciculaceae cyanobacterium RL_1_1]
MKNKIQDQSLYREYLFFKALKRPKTALKKVSRMTQHIFQDLKRTRSYDPASSEIVNHREICLIGFRRCGSHTFITWVMKQSEISPRPKHLNDIQPGENPFRHQYEYFLDHYAQKHPGVTKQLRKESFGNLTKKSTLIYNYEDFSLKQIFQPRFIQQREMYVGKSETCFDVLLLRDPYNLLASRFKKGFRSVKAWHQNFADMWIEFAKEYLGETQFLTNNKLCVSYNEWVTSRDYRQTIAEKLGLTFTDQGFDTVNTQAGGSSFDGLEYRDNPSQMKVFERWKHYEKDPIFCQILNNSEMLELSEKIFGHIPGTENFIR